jgi:uncharacterized heparinase superfamily protein
VLKRTARLFHTAKYLLPSQVAARAWRRGWRPAPRLDPAPPRRALHGAFLAPVLHSQSLVAPLEFRFLGERHALQARADWNDPARSQLWLYNLHYLDDLNAQGGADRSAWHQGLIGRWIAENPLGWGTGWEPYPVSRRLVNLIKWSLGGGSPDTGAINSVAVQARWLRPRFEWHLRGNHLLANAKALVFAGAWFAGAEADAWLAQGMRVLGRQLPEQILADGGHFERSPMYHSLVLEDLLDVCNILRAYALPVPDSWSAYAARMYAWLKMLSHPDGEIAFFNDAAFGVAAAPAQLEDYARRVLGVIPEPALTTTLLKASGYARLACGKAVLPADCAPVGPDYLPAHAHADTLSFELSLDGARVLVNSGTSEYGTGAERQRQRGTAAHNTVSLDGQDSSEVWHGFRVARRARPREVELESAPGLCSLVASHDGYARLPGRNIHTRRWALSETRLIIEDRVSGRWQAAVAHFHLHPDVVVCEVDPLAGTAVTRTREGLLMRWRFTGMTRVDDTPATWHPEFGQSVPSRCLRVVAREACLTCEIAWA